MVPLSLLTMQLPLNHSPLQYLRSHTVHKCLMLVSTAPFILRVLAKSP